MLKGPCNGTWRALLARQTHTLDRQPLPLLELYEGPFMAHAHLYDRVLQGCHTANENYYRLPRGVLQRINIEYGQN